MIFVSKHLTVIRGIRIICGKSVAVLQFGPSCHYPNPPYFSKYCVNVSHCRKPERWHEGIESFQVTPKPPFSPFLLHLIGVRGLYPGGIESRSHPFFAGFRACSKSLFNSSTLFAAFGPNLSASFFASSREGRKKSNRVFSSPPKELRAARKSSLAPSRVLAASSIFFPARWLMTSDNFSGISQSFSRA